MESSSVPRMPWNFGKAKTVATRLNNCFGYRGVIKLPCWWFSITARWKDQSVVGPTRLLWCHWSAPAQDQYQVFLWKCWWGLVHQREVENGTPLEQVRPLYIVVFLQHTSIFVSGGLHCFRNMIDNAFAWAAKREGRKRTNEVHGEEEIKVVAHETFNLNNTQTEESERSGAFTMEAHLQNAL